MARKKLIAGNWKMNGLLADGVELAKEIAAEVKKIGKPECEFLVCPPATLLTSVKKALRGAKVALGAQDCHWENKGAHTGDISPAMIKEIGCSYVILGHSERRADHCEINEIVQKKARAAHENGLKTIICIGESRPNAMPAKLWMSAPNKFPVPFPTMQPLPTPLLPMNRFGLSAPAKRRPRPMLKKFTPLSAKLWPKSWAKLRPTKCGFCTAVRLNRATPKNFCLCLMLTEP